MTNNYRSWYLIQRLSRRVNPVGKRGVDRLVAHDYMGSAEFEWGAVPRAWGLLRQAAHAGELVCCETPFHTFAGVPLYVIHHIGEDADAVFQGIFGSGTNAYHTKESTGMDSVLDRSRHGYPDICAWIRLGTGGSWDSSVPVFWSVAADLRDAVFEELHQLVPGVTRAVQAEDLKLFDTVHFVAGGEIQAGEVRGIFDECVTVLPHEGEAKRTLRYDSITKIIPKE